MISKTHLFSVGQSYLDFQVTKSQDIPELQCKLIELTHLPTNALVMHLSNQDPENLFCLSFQTLPDKSDGVAHILEHTVLCGSKKFPVKDPFFAMTRRSLNTFMNALTGSDFTCYPASTQVPKDFYNLLDVYLDAVFHPNLKQLSFLQEGHRLEFADPEDPNSPLEHKGVVFNEMKGVLSNPGARLSEMLHAALFPDITYGVNSGGSPPAIANLSYEELVNFHKTYYHPSRCLFFFYGNMPLQHHLDFISENALKGVEKIAPLPPIPFQKRFQKPLKIETRYPISEDEDKRDKSFISFGWLTANILQQQEILALDILQIVLMSTDASPLKKALLKSGLCKMASSHMDTDIHEIPWTITLGGSNPENADACEELIYATLISLVKEGIPLDLVENAMHQHEFHRSEIRADGVPFGLSLFMRSALLKQHKTLPEEGLKIHSLFDEIHRLSLEDVNYFGKLIKKHLLDNPHFVRIVMAPDKELASIEFKQEKEALEKIQKTLSDSEKKALVEQAKTLALFQQQQEHENIDVLPKVTLDDVPKSARHLILEKEKVGVLEVFHHPVFTNKIVYADLIWDLPYIQEADLPTLRLFTDLLTQMGAGGRSYSDNLEYIQANTGSIGAHLTFNVQAKDSNSIAPTINIKGKALHSKSKNLFQLLKDFSETVDFTDKSRLLEILHKQFTALESSLIGNAQRYAINLSASGLNVTGKLSNAWYGLDYFYFIKKLVQKPTQIDELIHKLKYLQQEVLCSENPHLVLTCENSFYQELKDHSFYGLHQLETKARAAWKNDYHLRPVPSLGKIIPATVAFIGKVLPTVSYAHPEAPSLCIASSLFDNITLHRLIREQGGAYGGGSSSNSLGGTFYFHSYRDPNLIKSLEAFEEAVRVIGKGQFTLRDLEEAKLEMIQGMDDPIKPGARGDYAYLWLREGRTFEARQKFRDSILNLSSEDVVKAVRAHIIPNMPKSATVVFAGKELLEKENAYLQSQKLPPLIVEAI